MPRNRIQSKQIEKLFAIPIIIKNVAVGDLSNYAGSAIEAFSGTSAVRISTTKMQTWLNSKGQPLKSLGLTKRNLTQVPSTNEKTIGVLVENYVDEDVFAGANIVQLRDQNGLKIKSATNGYEIYGRLFWSSTEGKYIVIFSDLPLAENYFSMISGSNDAPQNSVELPAGVTELNIMFGYRAPFDYVPTDAFFETFIYQDPIPATGEGGGGGTSSEAVWRVLLASTDFVENLHSVGAGIFRFVFPTDGAGGNYTLGSTVFGANNYPDPKAAKYVRLIVNGVEYASFESTGTFQSPGGKEQAHYWVSSGSSGTPVRVIDWNGTSDGFLLETDDEIVLEYEYN